MQKLSPRTSRWRWRSRRRWASRRPPTSDRGRKSRARRPRMSAAGGWVLVYVSSVVPNLLRVPSFSSYTRTRSLLLRSARRRVHRSLACARLRVHASLTTKIPGNPVKNLARAIAHQRGQEQHAMDSSLLAAMASAGDESSGGDGTMNGDGLRAPLGTGARDPTPWGDRTCNPAAKAAASRATEDMHTLIRALKTDLSCMSVRLERLEALLSA